MHPTHQIMRDRTGWILCDNCGIRPSRFTVKISDKLKTWLKIGWTHRKLIYLCHYCAEEFSHFASEEWRE